MYNAIALCFASLPLVARPRSAIGRTPDLVRYPVWQHTFVSPSAFSRREVVSYWRKYVHAELDNRLGGGGWSGGAKVLGRLQVPGRPTNLE